MIGSRVLAAATLLAIAVVLGGGGPRPEVAQAANAAIADAAERTLAAIDRLEAELGLAVDDGRAGAARVVAGDADPAERLAAAADRSLGAAPTANVLRDALADLASARIASRPDAAALPRAPDSGELQSISGQLGEAAVAGADFARMRRRAEALSDGLVDALDAVAAGRLDEADERLRVALDVVGEVRERQDVAPVLAVWADTTDAMIRAMQRLVGAVRADDPERAASARADFERAARDSEEADRSLRIGIGEAGSAQTAVPLGRLARVLVDLEELAAEVRAVRAGVSR
jgi:hypothetical protein